jgi:hypothetical protein
LGPIACPGTSVQNYPSSLRNSPEERRCKACVVVCAKNCRQYPDLIQMRLCKARALLLHCVCVDFWRNLRQLSCLHWTYLPIWKEG